MLASVLCAVLGLGCPEDAMPKAPHEVIAPAVVSPQAQAPHIVSPQAVTPETTAPVLAPECELPAWCESACAPYRARFVEAARLHPSRTTACHLARQACQESSCNPNAVSPAGATGLCQFLPVTAREQNVDPYDPQACIVAMAKYDAWCEGPWTPPPAYGRTDSDIRSMAFSCYNYGRGATIRHQRRHGWLTACEALPDLPGETAHYIEVIERPEC